MSRAALALVLTVAAAACSSTPQPPEGEPPEGEVDRVEIYQQVANALPSASFGWGEAPGVIEYAASTRAEGPPPALDDLKCTESGFRVRYEVYRPRTVWIPYDAITDVRRSWKAFPNALLVPLIVVPLQVQRTTVVFDATKVPGLLTAIDRDVRRLEALSREIGIGSPYVHAQGVKNKLEEDAKEFGRQRIALHFDLTETAPAAIPYGGSAEELGQAFAWLKEHPDERPLSDDEVAEAKAARRRDGAESGELAAASSDE